MNRSLIALPLLVLAATFAVGCQPKNTAAQQPGYGPPPPQYAGGYGGGYPQQPPQQGYPQQPPQQQYPQQPPPQQYPQQPPPQQQPGQPPPQQQPPAQGGFPFPFPIPGFPAPAPGGGGGQPAPQQGGGGTAQPIDPNLAQAAIIGLLPLEQQHARGMQKVGSTFAGNFQAGQTMAQDFPLTPNKCYTVLANSQGITELDLQIVPLTPFGPGPALAQDNGTGASAVLGGGGSCWTYQAPVGATGRIIMTARAGSGLAAGQLYMR